MMRRPVEDRADPRWAFIYLRAMRLAAIKPAPPGAPFVEFC
jgi:hypothetical protein